MIKRGRAEAKTAGVELCDATASKVERIGDVFEVTTSGGRIHGRRIVLAYGLRDELPAVPNIEKYYGGSVHHCPDCDGFEISDKRVAVIGSGKSVVGLALKLLQWTNQLTILTNGEKRDWSKEHTSKLLTFGIGVKDEKIASLEGDAPYATAAVLSTGERVELDAIFFTIGTTRSCDLAEQLGCKLVDDSPCLVVDDYKKTSVDGVYAAGDLVPGSQLAITSAADGAIAAIALNKSLLEPARVV